MFSFRFTLPPLLVVFAACGGSQSAPGIAELDFAEVENHTGWHLRIHGDGGGSLSHDQLPAYHLHYPAGTFNPRPARRLTDRCRGEIISPICTTVRYYTSFSDELRECSCAPGGWTAEIMNQAIVQMDLAVDSGSSERSCRMLRRQWLAAN
ncbi:MAG: hypothetical protein AAGF89_01560 [Bacteroidota bacterium]